jgi:DNA-3-methyladenine glycosylase I
MKQRCQWPGNNQVMVQYHDKEWGVPNFNDLKLFEYFVLDAFQAGLSWQIILDKRKNFKKAFHNFNPKKIATYTKKDINRLLKDEGIIRNRLKIEATIVNAQKYFTLKKEYGSFANYLWQFTNHKPIQNNFTTLKQIPTTTKESDTMSKDLKKQGFKFVGSTTCYAFMQGAGMVNDHTTNCFRYQEIKKLAPPRESKRTRAKTHQSYSSS